MRNFFWIKPTFSHFVLTCTFHIPIHTQHPHAFFTCVSVWLKGPSILTYFPHTFLTNTPTHISHIFWKPFSQTRRHTRAVFITYLTLSSFTHTFHSHTRTHTSQTYFLLVLFIHAHIFRITFNIHFTYHFYTHLSHINTHIFCIHY
jgi:hypothetical protein